MDEIAKAFAARGLSDTRCEQYLRPMIEGFVRSGACDRNYLAELKSDAAGPFWSRIWEAMLFERFRALNWNVRGSGEGPDFRVETPRGVVLVEASVMSPDGLPCDWLSDRPGQVYSLPHEAMLLRWTSQLSDKRKNHVDDIAQGRVAAEHPFVIALNSMRLSRDPRDPIENGISQWPFAVEATFPIGPLAVTVDRVTGKFGTTYQSLRFSVSKRAGVEIPTGNFLDPEYACVSALIGCAACYADESVRAKFNGQPPYFLVHNPLAANPLPIGWLPGAIEYAAEPATDDEFMLNRLTP